MLKYVPEAEQYLSWDDPLYIGQCQCHQWPSVLVISDADWPERGGIHYFDEGEEIERRGEERRGGGLELAKLIKNISQWTNIISNEIWNSLTPNMNQNRSVNHHIQPSAGLIKNNPEFSYFSFQWVLSFSPTLSNANFNFVEDDETTWIMFLVERQIFHIFFFFYRLVV